MARLPVEAGSVTRAGLGAVRQLAGGAARTHAAERCANAAIHTFGYVPNPGDPKGSQMTTASAGLAAVPCLELAAACRAKATVPGDLEFGAALAPVNRPCLSRRRSGALSVRGWPEPPTYRRFPTSSGPAARPASAGWRAANLDH